MPNAFDPKNKTHLVSLQGRQYITFVGLQALLIDRGLTLVGTDSAVLQTPTDDNSNYAMVKGTVFVAPVGSQDDREAWRAFSALGDASPTSVGNSKLVPHILRMAETRSFARALRFATRSQYTSREELASE